LPYTIITMFLHKLQTFCTAWEAQEDSSEPSSTEMKDDEAQGQGIAVARGKRQRRIHFTLIIT